ncbi:MAG: prepilin-type N-terminal cleavage/methylation domain-containing protein [Lachnospiraceae bacterium]|nr:prepilin-type N-terminal cleavage/methylation domain-containing protein [Lachnospiraceae bacterium]MBQ9610242.1 prepilin-type N-terminal cleavage/methylation domain-containing protein [Lachnospiraceae bacterium]
MKKIKGLFNDYGYSLVEMIIVIAIIVIMTGASFITLSVMHSAKAKEAASSFETELAMVISNSKNKSIDYSMDGVVQDSEKNYLMGLRVYLASDNKIYLQRCVISNGNIYDSDENSAFIKSINVGKGKGTCLSAYVDVIYTDNDGNETKITGAGDSDSVFLAFNKKGECVNGYGTYKFLKKNGSTVATVRVNKNGSYHVD